MDQPFPSAPDTLIAAPAPQNDIEKMFSGLGLDPFASGAASRVVEKPESMPAESNATLTIEDKQRLVPNETTLH